MTRRAFNAKTADQGRLMQVLIAPQVSEKSTFVGEKNNQWIFRVRPDATKPEIKAAVELMFKVEVLGVQTLNVMGKETKRFGRAVGRKRGWKKAFVRLEARAGDQLRARRQQVSSRRR